MLGGLLFKICFFDHKLYLQVVLFIIKRYRGNTVQFPLFWQGLSMHSSLFTVSLSLLVGEAFIVLMKTMITRIILNII